MILVDTGPLVGLADPHDRLHTTAARQLDRLVHETLVVCEAVLTEACFHLPHQQQRRRMAEILRAFSMVPYDGASDPGLRPAVWAWLLRYAEHEPDWADGYLAVVSGLRRRWRVWTFDREFRTTWRRPDGSPIPLVEVGVRATRR